MNNDMAQECLSEAFLLQYHSGELDPPNRQIAEQHLSSCVSCSKRNQELLAKHDSIIESLRGRDDDDISLHLDTFSGHMTASVDSRHSAPTHESMPRIEGYNVTRVLGRGGMGIVYEAVQLRLNRRVALKLLPSVVGSAHRELVERFRREASAASQLHHTNIIPIYDFGESRDGYFYAMELLDGYSLDEIVQRILTADGPIRTATQIASLLGIGESPSLESATKHKINAAVLAGGKSSTSHGSLYYRQVASWIADAAAALHYAHLQGLIHRDVKPSNIMLSRDGRIVVLDFGLVKQAGDESFTATGSLLGTYRYLSPEQIGAKRILIDARTDVYSLGATLYELLALRPAFIASTQSEMLGQILWNEPSPPRSIAPSVPIDLQTICLKAMEKSPTMRYATAQAMADDLRRFNEGLPIKARPLGRIGKTIKFARKRPLAVVLSSAVLVLVSAIVLFGFLHQRGQSDRIMALIREGVAHGKTREWQLGETAFGEALDLDSNHILALINYSYLKKDEYYETGDETDLSKALELADRAIAAAPDRAASWNAKAIVLRTCGRLQEALSSCVKANEVDPAYYAAHVNRGMVLALLGDIDDAESALQKGCQLQGEIKYANPWQNLAAIQLLRRKPEAWTSIEEAFARSNRVLPENLALRAMARVHLEDYRDPAAALKDALAAESVVGKDYSGTAIFRVAAFVNLSNKNWEAAMESAKRALKRGDPKFDGYCKLVLGIASAHGQHPEAPSHLLDNIESLMPEELTKFGYICGVEKGLLWFISEEEISELRGQSREYCVPFKDTSVTP